MIIDRLRQDASFMRVLTRADGFHKAYLIDDVEVQKISTAMIEAAEKIEALEARAIPDTHRLVPVELLDSAVVASYLSSPEIARRLYAIIEDNQR